MILQSLNDYYNRKCAHPDPREHLPDFGFEQKEIPFVLEINPDGSVVQLEDTRTPNDKKKLVGRSYRVPLGVKKSVNIAANLLWGTLEYAVGAGSRGTKPDRLAKQFAAFRQQIETLPIYAFEDAGVTAVSQFFSQLEIEKLQTLQCWEEALESNATVSFRLHGDLMLVCERPNVVKAVLQLAGTSESPMGMCLITGEQAHLQRLHANITGVTDAPTTGANIVSFNERAFESYGKTKRQGENAPVSQAAAFGYITALNYLLRRSSRQRIQIGDATTVTWAERETEFESLIPGLFAELPDNPDGHTDAVRTLYAALDATGKWTQPDGDTVMHVLGLTPNRARISIRFHHRLPLHELAKDVHQYFKDLELVRGPNDLQHPSLHRLLQAVCLATQTKPFGDIEKLPPSLSGAIVDAIFAGPDVLFPSLWLNTAVIRSRAEQNVNYLRAAAIKACLNRQIRRQIRNALIHPTHPSPEKEFLPMLDPTNTNTAYRLGRLFAVLEKAQEIANPGINATIRDRYYGAASSTPVAVFTTLLRLEKAHLKKMPTGQANWIESLIGEVLEPVADFPKHLPLPDQGRFALGYYQQRQFFFTKKPAADTGTASNNTPEGT